MLTSGSTVRKKWDVKGILTATRQTRSRVLDLYLTRTQWNESQYGLSKQEQAAVAINWRLSAAGRGECSACNGSAAQHSKDEKRFPVRALLRCIKMRIPSF